MRRAAPAHRLLLFGCAVLAWSLVLARPAAAGRHAGFTLTLNGSFGVGTEVSPTRALQAENLMLSVGAGFLYDCLRLEFGTVGAFGAIKGRTDRHLRVEFRPMLRAKLPLVPLYARAIFAGLSPFAKDRNIAYGGGLGLAFAIARVELFVEAATLPRRVADRTRWVVEGRAGLGFFL